MTSKQIRQAADAVEKAFTKVWVIGLSIDTFEVGEALGALKTAKYALNREAVKWDRREAQERGERT